MKTLEMVKAVSEREIVLPGKVGKDLGMKKGTKFILLKKGDSIILKKVEAPTITDFEKLSKWGVAFAREKGIKEKDVIKSD